MPGANPKRPPTQSIPAIRSLPECHGQQRTWGYHGHECFPCAISTLIVCVYGPPVGLVAESFKPPHASQTAVVTTDTATAAGRQPLGTKIEERQSSSFPTPARCRAIPAVVACRFIPTAPPIPGYRGCIPGFWPYESQRFPTSPLPAFLDKSSNFGGVLRSPTAAVVFPAAKLIRPTMEFAKTTSLEPARSLHHLGLQPASSHQT